VHRLVVLFVFAKVQKKNKAASIYVDNLAESVDIVLSASPSFMLFQIN
jgi:hypothetical protein